MSNIEIFSFFVFPAECSSGCHSEHGTCERPNECRQVESINTLVSGQRKSYHPLHVFHPLSTKNFIGVDLDGKDPIVTSVFVIQNVSMVTVINLESVFVKKDGEVSTAIKVRFFERIFSAKTFRSKVFR